MGRDRFAEAEGLNVKACIRRPSASVDRMPYASPSWAVAATQYDRTHRHSGTKVKTGLDYHGKPVHYKNIRA